MTRVFGELGFGEMGYNRWRYWRWCLTYLTLLSTKSEDSSSSWTSTPSALTRRPCVTQTMLRPDVSTFGRRPNTLYVSHGWPGSSSYPLRSSSYPSHTADEGPARTLHDPARTRCMTTIVARSSTTSPSSSRSDNKQQQSTTLGSLHAILQNTGPRFTVRGIPLITFHDKSPWNSMENFTRNPTQTPWKTFPW